MKPTQSGRRSSSRLASPAKPRSASVPPHPSRERIQERSFSFGNYLHSTSDWEHTLRKGSKAPQDGQGSTTGNRERAPGKGLKRQGRGIAVNRDSTDLPQTASACRATGAAFASTGATSSRRQPVEYLTDRVRYRLLIVDRRERRHQALCYGPRQPTGITWIPSLRTYP